MRPVDFLSSLSHYGAHLRPIWEALAPEERGTWWAPDTVARELAASGVERTSLRFGRPRLTGTPCVVASAGDAAHCGARPVVLVEHGAGQAYDKESPSYSGGPGRDNVVLFLCPNGVVAGRNRRRYPSAAAEVVGSPRLDALIAKARGDGVPHIRAQAVALSFHDGSYYWNMTATCSVAGCDAQAEKRGWCDKHYTRWRRHSDPETSLRPELGQPAPIRFWRFVDKNGPIPKARPDLGNCWLWTGSTVKGYGEFWDGGQVYAHRWSYEHHRGPIPERLEVDHLCSQPLCVRPDHLEVVTHGENMRRWMRRAGYKTKDAAAATVALSFHWDCPLVPETRWAYPWFKRALPDVAMAHPTIGHGHPRFAGPCATAWRRIGVEHVPDFADVIDRAHLYVCDNSSTIYEWAALGRPVVVLNAPGYRRDLDAWPRFWACADVGVQCDHPADILGAIDTALEDPPAVAARRAEVVDEVFPLRDGAAAARSVDALHAVLG